MLEVLQEQGDDVMDKNRFDELMAEATVDCYDEEEAFWGMFYTLDDKLAFPLSAQALGETITVLGLDGSYSGLRAGITVRVRKKEASYEQSCTVDRTQGEAHDLLRLLQHPG